MRRPTQFQPLSDLTSQNRVTSEFVNLRSSRVDTRAAMSATSPITITPAATAKLAIHRCSDSRIVSAFGWLIAQRRCGSMAL